MSHDTGIADLMLSAGPAIRRVVEVSRDCRVVSYDATAQTADLQPWVSDPELDPATGEVVGVTLPVVRAVPVRWPSGGGRALTWGLAAGDRVVAVIRTVSHDEADSGAACPVTPASLRRWSWSDAWCYPSGVTPTEAAPGARSDGEPCLELPAGEVFHVGGGSPEHTLSRADLVEARLNRLEAWMTLHTHPVAGALASPITPPAYTDVSALPTPGPTTTTADLQTTRLKVDG